MRPDLPDPREEFGPDIWDAILQQLALEAFRMICPDGSRLCPCCHDEEIDVIFRPGGVAFLECQNCGATSAPRGCEPRLWTINSPSGGRPTFPLRPDVFRSD